MILVLTKQMQCISETPGGVWYTLNRYSTPSTGGGGGGGGLLVLNRQRLTLGYKYSYLLSSKNVSAVPQSSSASGGLPEGKVHKLNYLMFTSFRLNVFLRSYF